jgi:hypothetical protein
MASKPPPADPDRETLFEAFPALSDHPFTVTSETTEDYNCFTHAVGRADVWSWPEGSSHWLPGVPREDTVASLVTGFRLFGYESCETGDHEPGVEKVCVYAKEVSPQHVARQLPSGEWTSKLGRGLDITHTLAGLAGPLYGSPVAFMKRPSCTSIAVPEWVPPLST